MDHHLMTPYLPIIISFSAMILATLITIQRFRRHRLLPPSPALSLPFIGHLHLLGPLIHHSLQQLSFKYGPIFSLNLGSVLAIVVSSPDLAKEFLKANELTFLSRKHTIAIRRLTYDDAAYAFSPYGAYWKFINKLSMTHLLSPRALTQFLPIRNDELGHLLRALARSGFDGSSVNVTKELVKLANNIISDMMFGIRCSNEEGQGNEAMALVREVTQLFGEFNVSDFVWLAKGWDLQKFNGRIEDTYRRYDSLLEGIISKREDLRREKKRREPGEEEEEVIKDFLDLLLDVMEDEGSEIKITRKNIKALILDFFTAATDTSAISIEWSLAELINNPRVLKKAQAEMDQVIGRDRVVQESDVANLPYLQAIIKENYRLHPPIPTLMRKSTQASTVNGYHIPESTLVFINIWAMGRDPKCWESPMDFRPERFVKPDSGGPMGLMELRGQNFQLLPFGSGRRGCPGVNLALQVVPIVLAALIQCFEWKSIDGSDLVDMSERSGLTAPRAHDLICVPVPRFDVSKIVG